MVHVTIHFISDKVRVRFESDYAFTKWLGYLKEHGLATVKLADGERDVLIFRGNITYVELEGENRPLDFGQHT